MDTRAERKRQDRKDGEQESGRVGGKKGEKERKEGGWEERERGREGGWKGRDGMDGGRER